MTRIIQRTLSIPTDARYLEDLRQFALEAMAEAGLPPRLQRPLAAALEETTRSVIAHAQDAGYTSEITVTIDIDDVRFKATIVDTALEPPDPATGTARRRRSTRDRRHRLPIFLLQRTFDELDYTYRRGFENRLEALKFLQ